MPGNALTETVMSVDFVPFLFSLVLGGIFVSLAQAMPIKLPYRLVNQQLLLRRIGRPVSHAARRKMTAV
jgi:hypothetical protein